MKFRSHKYPERPPGVRQHGAGMSKKQSSTLGWKTASNKGLSTCQSTLARANIYRH